jgi:hypothetical protein
MVIADYLLGKLEEQGYETEKILIYPEHRKDLEIKKVIGKLEEVDMVVLVFPLYVDSLPARTTRALELISSHRKRHKPAKNQRFMAICQSGFPESHQNILALDMCKCFAETSGFRWTGGLPIGAGGIVGEQNLAEAGGRVHHIRTALDMAAEAIARNEEIPKEAIEAASKLPIPVWLYRSIGNTGWKRRAKANGLRMTDLYAKPYAETDERSN